MSSPPVTESKPRLRRELGLWALVFYGIVLIQPTAPMPLFGIVSQEAKGHVVTAVLVAMCAMLLTALSYGRMSAIYPSSGSVYAYVSGEVHPAPGFVAGWSMCLNYLLNPVICTIWCAKASGNMIPQIPFVLWAIFYAVLFTAMNLNGIRTSARTTQALVLAMCIVITAFFVAAARYVLHLPEIPAGFWTRPFFDPQTFSFRAVGTGTSIAVLTYIGFDGISTLSEETHNPRRNILLATVLTCLITGIFSTAQVYAGQLIWPDYQHYPDIDTAFSYVAGRAGGNVMFHMVNFTLLVATIGSGMGAQLSASRLLYGMGRDNALPKRFFGAIEPKRGIPRNNVLFTGALILIGVTLFSYQTGAELLNFGAFIGFMGVNVAALLHAWRQPNRRWLDCILPALGFLICFVIWINLRAGALIGGLCWVALGTLYGAYTTNWFRRRITFTEGSE